ncbi:S1C family serine protease [Natronorubrum halophilum]|uniref:S1C family serine protease n=1 Tax=Natronorubrum halophilum TaxID=1702106 RepID=UPI000EF6FE37|nr:trypsin-like peptidase domain-containing protein [Natronorubrum halophilum]
MSPEKTRVTRRQLLRVSAGTAAMLGIGGSAAASADPRVIDASSGTLQDETAEGSGRYTDIYEETIDDVVLVNVFGTDEQDPGGLGSGFVVDDYVVTNNHVVRQASEAELQFRDEQWRTGEVVGTDVQSDIAVLSVDDMPDGSDGLSFADGTPEVGTEVLALGNPLGLDASISQGIVSGINRSLPSPSGFSIPAAIQTDAPVNPGNSGGPLVNLDGDVIGIVFAGAGQTIGFAISAELAERVAPALVEDGEYEHPYLGVGVLPVSPLVAEANDLEDPQGVLVTEVVPDAPADGVLEPADDETTVDGDAVPVGGDVIVAIGDREIPNQELLASTLALDTSPGETVSIEVIRDGDRETVDVTLESRPETDLP